MRLCAACKLELALDVSCCPRCGGLALALRPPADPNLGRVLDDRYEIRSLLGVGGMGTVYRAWQRSVGRDVAIKLVHRRYRSDVTWIRRFLREARLSSQVHHPNTVGIVDFGQTAEGDLYLAMELLAGRTLSEVVRQEGAFTPRRTLGVGVQICDALSALHERRIVHRDLTPQNIMILDQPAGRDHVKLLDFGLAKSLADGDPSSTQDSQIIGTPGYMAPEVPREAASPASDLYALGVILCEAHLGRRLFAGDSFAAVERQKHALADLPADVDPTLRWVLRSLLEPDPARRPHVTEVRAVLQNARHGSVDDSAAAAPDPARAPLPARVTAPLSRAVTAPAIAKRRQRTVVLAMVAVAVAGALAGAVVAVRTLAPSAATPGEVAFDPEGCQQRTERQTDLNNGEVWSKVWYCNNDRHTPLYLGAGYGPVVAVMHTINSWFVCYRRGERQPGGSDVWYYTQGDDYTPEWKSRRSWGYMAAGNLRARVHPYPGIPVCTSADWP